MEEILIKLILTFMWVQILMYMLVKYKDVIKKGEADAETDESRVRRQATHLA